MSVKCNPEEFLEVAEYLMNTDRFNKNSTYIRTAVGRSYYASFLCCWEKLSSIGIKIDSQSTIHRDVITKLLDKNSFISDLLDKLREERVKADYYMYEKFDNKRGNNSIKIAQEIQRRIPEIKKN